MSDSPTLGPPGWYRDKVMADTQRYWDGAEWTDHIAPLDNRVVRNPIPERRANGLAVVGFFMAILLPLVGFIIGCVLLRERPYVGVFLMVLSIFCAYVAYGLLFLA